MKIIREINGQVVEIELTPDEMVKTYYEQQHNGDMEDMEEYLYQYEDEEFFEEQFGRSIAEAENDIDRLARLLRTNIEKYGVTWENARHEALCDWSEEHKESA